MSGMRNPSLNWYFFLHCSENFSSVSQHFFYTHAECFVSQFWIWSPTSLGSDTIFCVAVTISWRQLQHNFCSEKFLVIAVTLFWCQQQSRFRIDNFWPVINLIIFEPVFNLTDFWGCCYYFFASATILPEIWYIHLHVHDCITVSAGKVVSFQR